MRFLAAMLALLVCAPNARSFASAQERADVITGSGAPGPEGTPPRKAGALKLSQPRFAPAAAATDYAIYIVGGTGAKGEALGSVTRLDLSTQEELPYAQLDTPRFWHRAVVVGKKLYVLGGMHLQLESGKPTDMRRGPPSMGQSPTDINAVPYAGLTRREAAELTRFRDQINNEQRYRQRFLASVEIIDLATGKVTRGPDMPRPRAEFACAAHEGKIYVFGGTCPTSKGKAKTNEVSVLDVASGKWTQMAPMPRTRTSVEAVVVTGGFIVVPGGYGPDGALTAVDVFNPRTNRWSEIPPLCAPRSAYSVAFAGHQLLLFGDYESPHEVMVYDLMKKTSEIVPVEFTESRHTAAAVAADRIYVFGGRPFRDEGPLNAIQVFTVSATGIARVN